MFDSKKEKLTSTQEIDLCQSKNLRSYDRHFGIPFCRWLGHPFVVVIFVIETKEIPDDEKMTEEKQANFYSKLLLATQRNGKLFFSGVTIDQEVDSVNSDIDPIMDEYEDNFSKVLMWEKADRNSYLYREIKVCRRPVSGQSDLKVLKF